MRGGMCMGLLLLVHMAIANKVDLINTPTYLFFFATPLILFYLTSTLTSLSPVDRRTLAKLLITPRPPGLRGRSRCLSPRPCGLGPRNRPLRTQDKAHVVRVRQFVQKHNKQMRWHTYLFAALWLTFQVGCCVEAMLCTAIKWVHALRWPAPHKICLALQANRHPA
jgi:hypothetical protein